LRRRGRRRYRFFAFFDVKKRGFACKPSRYAFAGRPENLWSPYRCTVVYLGTVAIGLTIIEMSEEITVRYVKGKYIPEKDYVPPKLRRGEYDHSWTTEKYFPTGRLCLQAYSPYRRTNWVKRWQETKDRDLNRQIKVIVKELEKASEIIARLRL
jgi:hypothetical protein